MHDELTARQRAISLRLAGRSVNYICAALGRVEAWFYKWWHRYLEDGPEGLYDLTRANHHVAQRIPPELERAILSVRRRLQAHATPATRYSLIGATVILRELRALGVRPLPSERTIERVLERNGLTAPRVRLALSASARKQATTSARTGDGSGCPTRGICNCRGCVTTGVEPGGVISALNSTPASANWHDGPDRTSR